MNELIAQLAERAAREAEENELALEVSTDEKTYQVPAGFIEKFSELIVRESADILLDWKKEPFPLDPDFAASLIKKHFGVEE